VTAYFVSVDEFWINVIEIEYERRTEKSVIGARFKALIVGGSHYCPSRIDLAFVKETIAEVLEYVNPRATRNIERARDHIDKLCAALRLLEGLVERAYGAGSFTDFIEMTDRDQAISFAYGNLKIDRPDLKREDVEGAYEELHPKRTDHRYVMHPTYTGVHCAICGRSEDQHGELKGGSK
jgi:hypothetical protein